MRNFKLSIIIVNHKTKHFLEKCLASIFEKINNIDFEVIVVDNGGDLLNDLEKKFNIRALYSDNNGYGSANNLGAASAHGDFLLFLNPDTEIISSDLCLALDFMKERTIGLLGLGLVNLSGERQSWSVGKKINLWDIILNNLGLIRSRKLWESNDWKQVDWVSGAAFLIEKDLFREIGGFDENFFMYYEDVDLCLQAQKKQRKIFYYPHFLVRHIGGASFDNENKKKRMFYISQDYYFEKNFGKINKFIIVWLRRLFG